MMMESESSNMISVRGVWKYYSDIRCLFTRNSKPFSVLADANMTVKKGSIYSLVGASGCGKTTLLGCVIGHTTIDEGKIHLGVSRHSDIGYMPQELGLQMDITVGETISFYGKLFELSSDDIKKRRATVDEFLQLSSDDAIVRTLSGGQRRRVSLCVALLHDPQLLILDEPTVGLDPTLSTRIWDYFVHLTSVENKTILITTHYIEEAKKAHRIGMMRRGAIMQEDSPNDLMQRYSVENLEDLFLLLAKDQSQPPPLPSQDLSVKGKGGSPYFKNSSFSWSHYTALLLNNFHFMKGDKAVMVTLALLPMVQCMLFYHAVGRPLNGLSLGMVNDELAALSVPCPPQPTFTCDTEKDVPLSCAYIYFIQERNIDVVPYEKIVDAREAALKAEHFGYLFIPHNYSTSLLGRLEENMQATDEQLDFSQIDVYLDSSNSHVKLMLEHDIYHAYMEYLAKLYAHCGWPLKAAAIPMDVKYVYGRENITFTEFTITTITELSLYFLPVIQLIGVIVSQKREKIWPRFFISGTKLSEIIVGHVTISLGFLVIQTATCIFIVFVVFDISLNGSFLLYFVFSLLVGVGGVSYGLFLGTLLDSEYAASFGAYSTFISYSVISGIFWPFEGMHPWLKTVTWYLPFTVPSEAFRSISIRGWDLSYPAVYLGLLISIIWTLIFGSLTLIVLRFKNFK